MSHVLILLLAFLPLKALADCGNLSRKLLNVTLGETSPPGDYLDNLPQGLRLSAKFGKGRNVTYSLQGQASGLTLRPAIVYWHDERVFVVQMVVPGTDEADIERLLKGLLAIAGTDVDANPKLIPPGTHLRCADGLSAHIVQGVASISASQTIPVLIVHVEHPKLHLRMQCTENPKSCEGTPRHLYE